MPRLLWTGRHLLRSSDGIYTVPEGFRLQIPDDDYFGWMMAWGYFAPELGALLRKYLRADDVFVDVGAHLGYIANFAAQLVGPSGLVLAIDADPHAFALLRANTRLNEDARIVPLEVAVSNRPGALQFNVASQLGWSSAVGTWNGGSDSMTITVPAVTLDALVQEHLDPGCTPRLVKIDVEGFEPQVLAGAESLLQSARTGWILEVHHEALRANASSFRALFDVFNATGHDVYWIQSGRRRFWHGRSASLTKVTNPARYDGLNGDIIAIPRSGGFDIRDDG